MQTQNRRHVRAMAVDDGIFMCNYAHRWPLLANTADGRKKKKLVMLFDEVTSLLHWHYHSALSTSDWVLKTIAGGCINDEIMLKRVLVWYRQCGFHSHHTILVWSACARIHMDYLNRFFAQSNASLHHRIDWMRRYRSLYLNRILDYTINMEYIKIPLLCVCAVD